METIRLTEYRPLERVELSHGELDMLLSGVVPSLSVRPSPRAPGRYDLVAGSSVGVVRLPQRDLVISPKIGIRRLLFLLSYAADRLRWREGLVDLGPDDDPLDVVALLFARLAMSATKRGLLHSHRQVDESMVTIRGRIRMDELARRRFGRTPPIDVRYSLHTPNITENCILLAAADALRRSPLRSDRARQAVGGIWRRLVTDVALHPAIVDTPVNWTRLNEHYKPAVTVARQILRSASVALNEGATPTPSFLVNMNQAFEDFVIEALADSLSRRDRSLRMIRQGIGQSIVLDEFRRVRLEPDITIWQDGKCVAVGDVKYKKVNAAGVKHPDLYQLLAYLAATDLTHGVLIYAAGEDEPRVHQVVHLGRRLEVVTLSLDDEPQAILEQVDDIAGRLLSSTMAHQASSTA